MKHVPRLLLIAVCALTATITTGAQSGWTPVWNGRNLDGWTTWMRQPEPTSEVPGLARGTDGRYTEPIGSDRDPLKVFTVAADVDGGPAIRISGEVFGELRTKRSFGRRRRATAACSTTSTRHQDRTGARGHDRSSCRSRSMTSAISMPWVRRLRCARSSGKAPSRRCTTTTPPANGCSSRRVTACPGAA